MRKGYLSEYFDGVAIKRLAAVEVDTTRSNQHEFNATREMLDFMGRPSGRERLPTKFIYLCDEDGDPLVDDASLTLYDSRENQPHRHPEYRFYFTDNEVVKRASEGECAQARWYATSGRVLSLRALPTTFPRSQSRLTHRGGRACRNGGAPAPPRRRPLTGNQRARVAGALNLSRT